MLYQLMNKDDVVAAYEERHGIGEYVYEEIGRFGSYLPHGFASIDAWIDSRQVAKRRAPIERLMRGLGLTTRHDFVAIARQMLTPAIRAKLVALKDFEYADPGLDYPQWKLDAANRLKDRQIEAILA